MRADLFKLADVALLLVFGREQRPNLRNLVALHVKQAGALRRVQPLMQRGAKVIAVEILLFEIKLRERVRAVDDGFHAVLPGHLTYSLYRGDLAGKIYLVSDLN